MLRTILLIGVCALGLAQPALAQSAPLKASSSAGKKALDNPDVITVRNVTRAELVAGIPIVEPSGVLIGTVSHLAVNDVIIVDGQAGYRVPITAIYAYMQDGADRFASRTAKASLMKEPLP